VLHAAVPQRRHGAERDEVLGREDGRRRVVEREQLRGRRRRHRAVLELHADELRVIGDARGRERLGVPAEALGRAVDAAAVAEVADPAVAGGQEVGRCRPGAAGVVGQHDVGVDEVRRAVDEDDRDAGVAVAREVAVVAPGRDDDQAVDAPREERLHEVALALGVLVGAAGEGEYAALAGDVLDPALEHRVKRVRDVVEDQADARRKAVGAAQGGRGDVAPVAEHRDGLADLLGEVGRDLRVVVDRPRHGTEADARDRGDLAHRGAAADRTVAAAGKRFAQRWHI
jgi:hypothetical protein